MRTLKVIATLAVVLALPALAGAQCADPNNLLSTDLCGFDTAASVGPTAWHVPPFDPVLFPYDGGIAAHSTTGGRTSSGSLLMSSADNGGLNIIGFEVCVPGAVAESTVVGFGLYANASALIDLGYLNLIPTNSDCTASVGNAASVTVVPPAPGSYGKLNTNDLTLTVPANTEGLKIELLLATFAAPFTMNVDDAYIGESMVPVELQHFSIE